MPAYLTRLRFESVEDFTEKPSAYLKRVEIVEVVDQDGNPWEPSTDIDDLIEYPPNEDANCLRVVLPHDLGPDVTTPTTRIFDLRKSCDDPRVIDLQLLGPAAGSTCLRVEYPYDLGPSVTTATDLLFDLRNDCDRPSTIDLGIAGPEETTTLIGDLTLTVNDIEAQVGQALTLLINDPVPASIVFDGDAENPTYLWSARANYPLMVGQQAANTVLTFPTEGMVTVQCKVSDGNSADSPQVGSVDVFVVDAFD